MSKAKAKTEQTVKPSGDIVASMVEEFQKEMSALIAEGAHSIVLDLADVAMIDSVGLGVMIATHNSLKANDGKLIILNASSDTEKLLKMMRLDQHFEMRASE